MKDHLITRATGAPLNRLDGVQKVTGAAKYAYEYPVDHVTYVFPVQSTIAKGRVVSIDTSSGDVETALAQAPVSLDYVYTTPAEHPNPLEPHTTVAVWNEDSVTLYDSNQGPHPIRDTVATAFKLPPERVRVISKYVGGAFGSKVDTHPHVILAVM